MKKVLAILAGALLLTACGDDSKEETQKVSVPEAPSRVALHGTPTETSLTFQWTAVSGATSYEYKLMLGMEQVQSETVKSRNVTVSGLTAGTTYQRGRKVRLEHARRGDDRCRRRSGSRSRPRPRSRSGSDRFL